MNLEALLNLAKKAAFAAGDEIMQIKNPLISRKADGSVLSSADLRSNEIITQILSDSRISICSEEAILPYEQRCANNIFWLIDPLDGSSNYLKERKNFCICIALIEHNRPILGLIYDVINRQIYSGYKGSGVYLGSKKLLPIASISEKAVVSMRKNSHRLNKSFILDHKLEPIVVGSALKFCALLNGDAQVYARFDSLNSWDIAAGDFLINEQGGLMIGLDHAYLDYNQPDFACSPFIATSASLG